MVKKTDISRHQLATIIAKIAMTKKLSSKELSKMIASYLLTTNQLAELQPLLRDIQAIWAVDYGYSQVSSQSSYPVDEKLLEAFAKLFVQDFPSSNKLVVSNELEPSLIGGLRLTLADRRLDVSILQKFQVFRSNLVG